MLAQRGLTPLWCAALNDKPEAVRALVRHKAKVDVVLEAPPAGSSSSGAAASAAGGAVGQTPLFCACAAGKLALVKALIDGGANVNFARTEVGLARRVRAWLHVVCLPDKLLVMGLLLRAWMTHTHKHTHTHTPNKCMLNITV